MLEALLFTYQGQFGEPFPLKECEGMTEIEVIDLLYSCLRTNQRYSSGMYADDHVSGAPGRR